MVIHIYLQKAGIVVLICSLNVCSMPVEALGGLTLPKVKVERNNITRNHIMLGEYHVRNMVVYIFQVSDLVSGLLYKAVITGHRAPASRAAKSSSRHAAFAYLMISRQVSWAMCAIMQVSLGLTDKFERHQDTMIIQILKQDQQTVRRQTSFADCI